MEQPDLPHSPHQRPPEVWETLKEQSDLPSLLRRAEKLLGTYQQWDRQEWKSDEIERRKTELGARSKKAKDILDPRNQLTVQDAFEYDAHIIREHAMQLLQRVDWKVDKLAPADRREVIAAQLRVTSLELFGKTLQRYVDIVRTYQRTKDESAQLGVSADPKLDAVVQAQLQEVVAVGERIVQLKLDIQHGARQEAPAALQEEMYSLQTKLYALLKSRDERGWIARTLKSGDRAPGANPEGIVPAHAATLKLLQKRYEHILDLTRESTKEMRKANDRVEQMNRKLRAFYGGKAIKIPAPNDADGRKKAAEMFQRAGVDFAEYERNVAMMELQKSTEKEADRRLKQEGSDSITALASVNRISYEYQMDRVELATLRHHINQLYGKDEEGKLLKEGSPTPEAALAAHREFLADQQRRGVGRVRSHLDDVENTVLRVGIPEKIETRWNEKGRLVVSRLADLLTNAQTSMFPSIEGPWPGPLDQLRQALNAPGTITKEYLMARIPELIGWPRYTEGPREGELKKWEDLSDAEKKRMSEAQDSIEKAVRRFQESDRKPLQRVRESTDVVETLIKRPDFKTEGMLSIKPVDQTKLPARVTKDNVDQLLAQGYSREQIITKAFNQWKEDWEVYSESYGQVLQDFHNIIGVHIDWAKALHEFGDRQLEWWLYVLYGLAGVGGAVILWQGIRVLSKARSAVRTLTSPFRGAPRGPAGGPGGAPPAGPAARAGAAGAEIAKEGSALARLSPRAARVLGLGKEAAAKASGPLLAVASGIQAESRILHALNRENLKDAELADAALEVWKDGTVRRGFEKWNDGRYDKYPSFEPDEIRTLEARRDAVLMRETVADQMRRLQPIPLKRDPAVLSRHPAELSQDMLKLETMSQEILAAVQAMQPAADAFRTKADMNIARRKAELPIDGVFGKSRGVYDINISSGPDDFLVATKLHGGPFEQARWNGHMQRTKINPSNVRNLAGDPKEVIDPTKDRAELERAFEGVERQIFTVADRLGEYRELREKIMDRYRGETDDNPIGLSYEMKAKDLSVGGDTAYLRIPADYEAVIKVGEKNEVLQADPNGVCVVKPPIGEVRLRFADHPVRTPTMDVPKSFTVKISYERKK